MPKIRLNKAAKELNISIPRAVEFLQSKGFEIDSNPNVLLEAEAFSALEQEFAADKKQKEASQEVVISKVPEVKLETEEPKAPEVIKAQAPKTKIIGKIDLEAKPKKEKEAEAASPKEVVKEEVVAPKPEITKDKKTEPKAEPKPKTEPKAEAKPVVDTEESSEPEKIETKYQKLDGPKILQTEKIDLSQFETKPKPSDKKKQRKRIQKPAGEDAKPANNKAGADKKFAKDKPQGGNRDKGGKKGGKRERVMPVELTDEQVKNQIKETLEKLTNKGGKSKGAKYRKEKRNFRREQDELQQELEAQDKTLKVTEFITVNELAALMDVSPTEVISACFSLGVMVTMNQRLEADILTLVADEFGYKIEFSDADLEEN